MKSRREDAFIVDRYLTAIVFLAFALRLTDLAIPSHYSQPDEMFSLEVAAEDSLAETIRRVASDTHPPFYFILLRYWLKITSQTLLSAKILSIIFNVTNILATCYFCRLWVDRRTARWAALFMALSPWNIYWSHLARNHQMLPPLFTLSSLALLRWTRSDKKGFPFAFFIWTTLMIHTNYLAFFILAAQGIIVLWECRRRIARTIAPGIAVILALLTYIPYKQVFEYQLYKGPMNAPQFQHMVSPGLLFFRFIFFNIFTSKLADLWYPPPISLGVILVGGLIMGGILIMTPKKIRDASFYMLLILPPTFTVIYAKLAETTMAERYLAYTIGPFCIALAAGFAVGLDRFKLRIRFRNPSSGTSP